MSAGGLTARQFAEADGCSHTLVNRAIKQGKLRTLDDGTIDPSQIGSPWRKQNRAGGNKSGNVETVSGVSIQDDETLSQAAERIIAATGPTMSQAEAERVKENYLALLRQLEYDTKAGAVVEVPQVAKLFGEACSKVRTKLLAIPAEQAPAVHRCQTVAEVQALLSDIITEALEELTRGHGDPFSSV